MITYSNEIRKKNIVYSIDKLVVDFRFPFVDGENLINGFLKDLHSNNDLHFEYWVSSKFASFKNNFSFKVDKELSFWVGVGFNSARVDEFFVCRIEFNPNKVFETYDFKYIFNVLHKYSKSCEIKRFDLAVDYPILRQNCYLIKDNRLYREDRRSYKDRTQYLGKHNSHGFVKLYNKMIESKLNNPLTRFEMTIDYDKCTYIDIKSQIPDIVYIDDLQVVFDELKINDTDRFILKSVLDDMDSVKMLGRYQRKKIECILERYTQHLEIDVNTYNKLIEGLNIYFQPLEYEKSFNPFTLRNEIVFTAKL